ncbi:uncharacterized protein LOC124934420 [Impatiens glandulifera]|uniref:uncharacterized protein LOC124934318 n=1 Tax=Impatiens glandulifera TaxID=253017 RepID=UPI001FB09689|nr:uncharacterized protein LOC124934318 [Impatiens glandulifera]XP_047330910.1 uncharacterized protein LOC124934420 [Impatiens glandulifera]
MKGENLGLEKSFGYEDEIHFCCRREYKYDLEMSMIVYILLLDHEEKTKYLNKWMCKKYWTFIEDNGYKVLVDSLLDEQEKSSVRNNIDVEKDTYSLAEGEIDPKTLGGENEDVSMAHEEGVSPS